MDQIFRINVGPETIQGRLPAVRVGKGFCSLFHITGVAYDDTVPVPKIWIGESENTALFWEAVWDSSLGLWVVEVGGQAAATAGTFSYVMTMSDEDGHQYIAGAGVFTVYTHIAIGGGETGATGQSTAEILVALTGRIEDIESRFAEFALIGMFDPESAFDIDVRTQVQMITNALRGS